MGYFPNGTAGDMYEALFCNRCIHEDDEKGCPVMLLHVIWNYDAVGEKADETKREALELLIPRDKDGWNEQCRMFVPR